MAQRFQRCDKWLVSVLALVAEVAAGLFLGGKFFCRNLWRSADTSYAVRGVATHSRISASVSVWSLVLAR